MFELAQCDVNGPITHDFPSLTSMAMASLIHRVILVQLLILSVATIATARPCKTLLISSYSFSFKPVNQQNLSSSSSSRFVTIFTEISHFNPKPQLQEQVFPTTTEIFLFRDLIIDPNPHCQNRDHATCHAPISPRRDHTVTTCDHAESNPTSMACFER